MNSGQEPHPMSVNQTATAGACPHSSSAAAAYAFTFKQKKAGSHLLSPVRSIIGAGELDFRVRNGNGYCLPAMATGI